MQKRQVSGAVLSQLQTLKSKLGFPKHEAPDEPFYVCPYGVDEGDDHRVDLDESSGQWYCMDCDLVYEGPRHWSRLDTLHRRHILEESEYEEGEARPVRKNQKITDADLEEYFEELEGKYVLVSDLKKIFGPTPARPDGMLKVNDKDNSTTAISSSFMRRLGRITGLKWSQEKALAESDEPLVRFTKSEEMYVPRKKKSLDEKFRDYQTARRIEKHLEGLEDELVGIAIPVSSTSEDTEWGFTTTKMYDFDKVNEWPVENRQEYLRIIKALKFLEGLLGIKSSEGKSDFYPMPNVRKIERDFNTTGGEL
jgi:hypothetical protein